MPNVMSLFLYQSNRLEPLVARLAVTCQAPLSSPFVAEQVVVETQGMAQWLRLELARRNGIAANLQLPFPRAFISGLINAVVPAELRSGAIEPAALAWRIMGRLDALLPRPEFKRIREYLAAAEDPRRQFQLAERIAALFDQYSVYRPKWIEGWLKLQESTLGLGPDGDWQASLWREVMTEGLACQGKFLYELIQALGRPTCDRARLPERLSVMVASTLPASYLAVFEALGRHIPVHLFCLSPSREYWGDLATPGEAGRLRARAERAGVQPEDLHLDPLNPLLASCGRTGREFQNVIAELEAIEEPLDLFEPPTHPDLLGHLQASILTLEGAPESRPVIRRDDRSLQIHACHSPLRELQVLRDHLLEWFAADPTLAPGDVLVMFTEVETYAPYLKGVFDSAEPGAPAIPYTVSDRGGRGESALTDGFISLLQLASSRLTATAVTDFFEMAPVRRRFGVAEEDLEQVRLWIQNAAIRWGQDGPHRARLGLPAFEEHSWEHGCNRLLLGYAMPDGRETLVRDLLPCDGVEGTATALLGRWLDFLERLFAGLDTLSVPRALESWATTLNQVLDELFLVGAEDERAARTLRQALDALRQQQRISGFDHAVPLSVILERLVPQLEAVQPGGASLRGTVTFAGLGPMRGIPFKAVCLLGLNDGAFPRNPAPPSFDLMARHPCPGDESQRDDDRYLFLQSLLSARERLYASYVGLSTRDNSPRPPSVVVSELLDFVGARFRLEGDPEGTAGGESALITDLVLTVHRLHAFSPAYFQPAAGRSQEPGGADARLFSYASSLGQVSQAVADPARRPPVEPFVLQPFPAVAEAGRTVALRDLQRFFRNPARAFVEKTLEFKLPEDKDLILDEEPFSVDGLDVFQCKQAVLEAHLSGKPAAQLIQVWRGQGKLPPGPAGLLAGNGFIASADPMLARLTKWVQQGRPEMRPVRLELGARKLEGELPVYPGVGVVHYRAANVDPKKKGEAHLRLWIDHLVLQLLGPEKESVLVGEDQTWVYQPVAKAGELLVQLLDIYEQGLTEPLPFFPKSALVYVRGPGVRTKKTAAELALETWEGSEFDDEAEGECEDPYFNLCFRNHPDPLGPGFRDLAAQVFGAWDAHARKED